MYWTEKYQEEKSEEEKAISPQTKYSLWCGPKQRSKWTLYTNEFSIGSTCTTSEWHIPCDKEVSMMNYTWCIWLYWRIWRWILGKFSWEENTRIWIIPWQAPLYCDRRETVLWGVGRWYWTLQRHCCTLTCGFPNVILITLWKMKPKPQNCAAWWGIESKFLKIVKVNMIKM